MSVIKLTGCIYILILIGGTWASLYGWKDAEETLHCDNVDALSEPWLSFLCVTKSNSPFLGEFYPDTRLDNITWRHHPSIRFTFKSATREGNSGFEPGSKLQVYHQTENIVHPLKLPKTFLKSGVCTENAPAFLFENRRVSCSRKIARSVDRIDFGTLENYFSLSRYITPSIMTFSYRDPRLKRKADAGGSENPKKTHVPISTVFIIRCFRNIHQYTSDSRSFDSIDSAGLPANQTFFYFNCDTNSTKSFDVSKISENRTVAYKNVLVDLRLNFRWNYSAIENVVVEASLIDIQKDSLDQFCQKSSVPENGDGCSNIFINQKFEIEFSPEINIGLLASRDEGYRWGYAPREMLKIVRLPPGTVNTSVGYQEAKPWIFGFGATNLSLIDASMQTAMRKKCFDTTPIKLGTGIRSACDLPIPNEVEGVCTSLRDLMTNTMEMLSTGSAFLSSDGSILNETIFVPIFSLNSENATDFENETTEACINVPVGLKYYIFTDRNLIVGAGYRFHRQDIDAETSSIKIMMSIEFTEMSSHRQNTSRFWTIQQDNICHSVAWKNILNGLESPDEYLVFATLVLLIGLVFKPS